MNFLTFDVETTNIFPAANSQAGGQLLTEYNLKSRESVSTSQSIKYPCGVSFVHSEDDFKVSIQKDSESVNISSSVLTISEGRGVIDGHFIETLAPMVVDLAEGNMRAAERGESPLKGKLSIGLRMMYSTEATVAGSIEAENSEGVYEGVQVIVLPQKEFILPIDSPSDRTKVTAHIKLADFSYINGSIISVVNNYPAKCKYISPDRILEATTPESDIYVRRDKLKFGELYTMSGKNPNVDNVQDTWCPSTSALMIWDRSPVLTHDAPSVNEATFIGNTITGQTQLVLPHQQVDGMTDTQGKRQYYQDKVISLPVASFGSGSPGTVDRNYTKAVKQVLSKVNDLYNLPSGKQVGCIDLLSEKTDLYPINSNWVTGDYVLVRQDKTVVNSDTESTSTVTLPSTMYVLLPGVVKHVKYSGTNISSLTGVELMRVTYADPGDGSKFDDVYGKNAPESAYNDYLGIKDGDCDCTCGCDECKCGSDSFYGLVNSDYFTIDVPVTGRDGEYVSHYYVVTKAGDYRWSDPFMLTGETPFASDTVIGGFLDVPENYVDSGYVKLDENGNLRLIDYSLLRSGVLAYQLGSDFELPSGITNSEIQSNLDEYVNERVVFPNYQHVKDAVNPNVITVNITLTRLDDDVTEDQDPIVIHDVDSRFEGILHLILNGNADTRTIISIVNCKKIKITDNTDTLSDPENVTGPTIKLYNSSLCYDPIILNRLSVIENMSLWYQRVYDTDPNLMVTGMTVQELDTPIIPQNISYWSEEDPNDYHYMYALQSVTFGNDGTIIGCGLYVCNHSTTNINFADPSIVVSTFELPQTLGLSYPEKRMTKKLKVSGSFVNAYGTDGGFMTENTQFTAVTQPYDDNENITGTISFLVNPNYIPNSHVHVAIDGVNTVSTIDGWENNSFHLFYGGVVE